MAIKSIMIIDDSKADQFLSKHTIEGYDDSIEVLQAYNGKEALALIETLDRQPDIILLDINMPVMNGIEFLEAYTQAGYTSSVVVMLTSSDQQKDTDQCTAYQCVKEYLTKPLDHDDLARLSEL